MDSSVLLVLGMVAVAVGLVIWKRRSSNGGSNGGGQPGPGNPDPGPTDPNQPQNKKK